MGLETAQANKIRRVRERAADLGAGGVRGADVGVSELHVELQGEKTGGPSRTGLEPFPPALGC